MRNIAVVSSGTDAAGVNAAIRAIARAASADNCGVFGVNWGFQGLVEDKMSTLTSRDVSGKIGRGGCFLGTQSPVHWMTDANLPAVLEVIKKREIEGLICIGGKLTMQYSTKLMNAGVPMVFIPSTVQDDIVGTDIAIGVDSAVNNIVKAVDKIRTCDASRERNFLVRVDGAVSGHLALRSAIACGAELCLLPEQPATDLGEILERMNKFSLAGKSQCITIVAKGWKPGIEALTEYIQQRTHDTDIVIRESLLGYIQRGGPPTGFDRLLGTSMGHKAYKTLTSGGNGILIGYQNNEYVEVPLSESLDKIRPLDPTLLEIFNSTI